MTGQNRSKFLKGEGLQLMNLMLRLIQIHSKVDMLEILFNCLCSCLLTAQNRSKFLKGEGLQLMNLMLRLIQIYSENLFNCLTVYEDLQFMNLMLRLV